MNFEKELKELFLMQQAYATLFAVSNKLQIEGDKYFGGLSSRQYMTILAVLHLPESETTLNNIAKKMGTTKQNVKQLINVLEKKGYIEIKPSETDKRAINVKVTQPGFNEMVKCGEIGITFMADVFCEFTVGELEVLWDLLKKLYRFDGEEQDGFEDDPSERFEQSIQSAEEIRTRVLHEFSRRRNGSELDKTK